MNEFLRRFCYGNTCGQHKIMHTWEGELACFWKWANGWVMTSRSSNLRLMYTSLVSSFFSLLWGFNSFMDHVQIVVGGWTLGVQSDWYSFDYFWPLLGNMGPKTEEWRLKALSVDLSYPTNLGASTRPIFRPLETPLLRYSGSSV